MWLSKLLLKCREIERLKKKRKGEKVFEERGMANVMMRCLLLYMSSYPLFTVNINQSDIPSHMFNEQKRDIFMCGCVLIFFSLRNTKMVCGVCLVEFKTTNKMTFGFMCLKSMQVYFRIWNFILYVVQILAMLRIIFFLIQVMLYIYINLVRIQPTGIVSHNISTLKI